MVPLYEAKLIQTLWNAERVKNSQEGWTLVSGAKSPWYFNIRPLGCFPRLFSDVSHAMAELVNEHRGIDLLVGIEMAGIPLVGAVSPILLEKYGREIKIGYTRPLRHKGLKPEDIVRYLEEEGIDAAYGQKSLVEVRFSQGDNVAIFDDMATNLGSKIVARYIALWDAGQRGINLSCKTILYFLNRGAKNKELGLAFRDKAPELFPEELEVDYVLEFNEHLPLLRKAMRPQEYELISQYQKDPEQFQDQTAQKKVFAQVAKDLGLEA